MAPSGGLPSLDEFLQLTEADVYAWSDTKVIQACFEYGLVAEGDDSEGQTLRERLVELLRSLTDKPPPSQQAGPSSQVGVGQAGTTAYYDATDGSLSSDSGLLRTPGGRFVTPTASLRTGGPPNGEPPLPFAKGPAGRPQRDVNPLPFGLDPEDPAVVDAMDSLAEGMVLTPGHDPYAHGSRSSSGADLSSYADTDDGDDQQQGRTPLGPSMARNIFGEEGRRFPPRRTGRRLTKRNAALRSPFGDGEGRAFSRQNSGETPARIRALPNVPFGFQPEHQAPIPEDIELPDAAKAAQTRSEKSGRDGNRANVQFDDGARGANDDDQANIGTDGARAAGPTVQQEGTGTSKDGNAQGMGGVPNNDLGPPQDRDASVHQPLPKEGAARRNGKEGEDLAFGQKMDQREQRDPYRRVTVLGWARLAKLGGRPTSAELQALKDEDLKAVIRSNGGKVANWWTRQHLLEWVKEWLAANPVRQLVVPKPRQEPANQDDDDSEDAETTERRKRKPPKHRRRKTRERQPHQDHRPPHVEAGSSRHRSPLENDAEDLFPRGSRERRQEHPRGHSSNVQDDADGKVRQREQRPGPFHSERPPPERPDPRRPPDVDNAARPSVAQAAEALRATAGATLAALDRVALLVARAGRGEPVQPDELATLEPAIQASRTAMAGIVAGLASSELCGALQKTREGPANSEERADRPNGAPSGRRTYADAASRPSDQSSGAIPRHPPPAALAPSRTALLQPTSDSQRHAPTRAGAFGAELDAALRSALSLGTQPAVELVRRTGKGDYAVQFSVAGWRALPGTGKWTLPSFGTWIRASNRTHRPRSSIVLTGIPKTISQETVAQQLATGAAACWRELEREDLEDIRVERLNRRVNATNDQDAPNSGGPHWAPSLSVRVFASRGLCEAILKDGGAVVGFSFHTARPFEPATRRCLRCGQVGVHTARFCRNPPRCRLCGQAHETIACPQYKSQQRQRQKQRQPTEETQADQPMQDCNPNGGVASQP